MKNGVLIIVLMLLTGIAVYSYLHPASVVGTESVTTPEDTVITAVPGTSLWSDFMILKQRFYASPYPADVIVYRDGDYAVAVDGRTKIIILRSTDHTVVLQKAINEIAERGGGKIYILGEITINNDITIPQITTNDYHGSIQFNHQIEICGGIIDEMKGSIIVDRPTSIYIHDITIEKLYKPIINASLPTNVPYTYTLYRSIIENIRVSYAYSTVIDLGAATETTISQIYARMYVDKPAIVADPKVSQGIVMIMRTLFAYDDSVTRTTPAYIIGGEGEALYYTMIDTTIHENIQQPTEIIRIKNAFRPTIIARDASVVIDYADNYYIIAKSVTTYSIKHGIVAAKDIVVNGTGVVNIISPVVDTLSVYNGITNVYGRITTLNLYGGTVNFFGDYISVVNNYGGTFRANGWGALKKFGVTTIPAGSTNVTVTHGMKIKPSIVIVTPTANVNAWVTSITDTTFTIQISQAQTSDITVYWMAVG